jgi:hypothetical protein
LGKEKLRRRRHYPLPQQGHWLQQVVRGFFAYHAVPTNMPALVMVRLMSDRELSRLEVLRDLARISHRG